MLDKKGFSLVELMVVITIIAILVSIGVPIYNSYLLRNHRSEATSELLSAANAADNYEIRYMVLFLYGVTSIVFIVQIYKIIIIVLCIVLENNSALM